tara:strand:+ start:834 stop:1016 length:183 start_codon:yes stop_codon:yes gene_type:complete
MISIKLPMIYEKTATPNKSIAHVKILSGLDLGLKSPKPTVDRDVKEKYVIIMAFSYGVFP